MSQLLTIRLSRQDAQPWGFRLQGGKDFGTPLIVQKVNGGSLAEQAGLIPGDAVIKINNMDVFNLRHKDAQDAVVRAGNIFEVTVQRGGSTWRPNVTPVGSMPSPASKLGSSIPAVTRTSLAHKPQEVRHIGSGYNSSARPFSSVNGTDGQVKSIVNKQYNSPVGIYSEEAIAETLSAQAEVLAGGVLGVNFKKNEKVYNSANSEVYKFLHEQENEPEPEPKPPANFFWTASHAIGGRKSPRPRTPTTSSTTPVKDIGKTPQQHVSGQSTAHNQNVSVRQPVPTSNVSSQSQPQIPKSESITATPPSTEAAAPPCHGCGLGIVGVFVRIKDRNLHVDCFKCATCGTSLKNQGYFNFNNKLYCDIHAKLAAMQNPPAGTEGYVPVPIKATQKLSANTISAALNAHHGGQSNGTAHLISSPTSHVNQGYGGPKPFGAGPKSPTIGGPRSPSSYPPPGQAPSWIQPKPATNPYATLPRASGQSQEECLEQSYEYRQEEEQHFDDLEVAATNRGGVSTVIWPPPVDENRLTPTASPLYIAPPETQHVVPKPSKKLEKEQISQHESKYEQITQEKYIEERKQYNQHNVNEQQVIQHQQQQHQQHQQQWQSRSAPELGTVKHNIELESSSDSYTSTSTTTTTTSEEYQRMYQAQMQAYQMQQMYEQSGSEIDYHMDMEVANVQQGNQSYSSSTDFASVQSGRRSAQECAETIVDTLSTYKLIDMVREVTPSPTPPSSKGPKRVEFAEDKSAQDEQKKVQKVDEKKEVINKEEKQEENTQKHTENMEKQRKFQPTPEIVIEIADVKPVPPTNIPNPVPKQWVSPMVQALTTVPDKPITITDVCEKSCGAKECEEVCAKSAQKQERYSSAEVKEVEQSKFTMRTEVLKEEPPKGSFIAKALATAPEDPVKFTPKSGESVSLPEEIEPYMPPPIDMKPYESEDFRPKSPLVKALTTAPDTPYNPFGEGVTSQLDDLPRPKSKLTMIDALTVAPDRPFTPLGTENTSTMQQNERKDKMKESSYQLQAHKKTSQQQQDINTQIDRQISAFAGYHSFQPRIESIDSSKHQSSAVVAHQKSSLYESKTQSASACKSSETHYMTGQQQSMYQSSRQQCSYQSNLLQTSSVQSSSQMKSQQSSGISTQQTTRVKSDDIKKVQGSEQKQTLSTSSSSSTKKDLASGLHKPDSIPQYQRNWTILPSQRPIKTPEPPELKENVPLAFVEVPREASPNIQKPTAIQHPASSTLSSVGSAVSDVTRTSESKQKISVPIISEQHTGPITMTFQSIDEKLPEDHSHAHPRPFTPSLINKAAPIVPFYQMPEKLTFEECPPRTSQPFDRRSVSPCPDRAKSPAPGPPPNPLVAIRAPRLKDEITTPRSYQTGSITTGQPYHSAQIMQQQQGQLLSHYQAVSQTGSQRYIDKPEVVQEKTVGDMTIQRREKERHLNEEQRSQMESKTTTQVGNAQIERRRRVVEEYEHTQTAKTIEIRKTSGERFQPGRTGFVTNQAKRLSGLEQEISNLTSQSQAISAKAANLGERDTRFPQCKSPSPINKFPIKDVLCSDDEPKRTSSSVCANFGQQNVAPPPGFKEQREKQSSASTSSSYATSSKSQSSLAQQSFTAKSNTSLTASNTSTAIQIPAYKPVTPTATAGLNSAQQNLQQPNNVNNTYKPTPSVGPAGFKPPPPPPQSSNKNPNIVVSDPTPASAGSAKGGSFGATSAPRRGRGILNKAVGPGVRIPLCGCCNTQVRGPFITALGRIWCPEHFICVNANCRRPLQDIGFVEEKGDLYCEYCFEKYLAPTCSKCNAKIKGDCLNAIGKHFHPECFTCSYCGKLFGNSPFFLEEGEPYCEADWNELFTTKCFACGFPVEAGDRWVEALNHNYHSQCFNCTMCKKNLEGQSFYNKGGRPFCKNHAR